MFRLSLCPNQNEPSLLHQCYPVQKLQQAREKISEQQWQRLRKAQEKLEEHRKPTLRMELNVGNKIREYEESLRDAATC